MNKQHSKQTVDLNSPTKPFTRCPSCGSKYLTTIAKDAFCTLCTWDSMAAKERIDSASKEIA